MMEATKELTDAADLLTMLDCLTDSLSRDTTGSSVPPWAGIKLTIRQTREIILGTQEKISRQSGYADPIQQRPENTFMPQSGVGQGLADRVQQIPPTSTGSRARDLLNNVAAAGKVTRVQAPVQNMPKTAANESGDM